MQKVKVIGYGLGKMFVEYREQIEKIFDVIAWCDTDEEKRKAVVPNISLEELRNLDELGGNILIIPTDHEASCNICNELIDKYGIGGDRIIFLEQTMVLQGTNGYKPETIYYGQYGDDAIIKNIIFEKNLGIDIYNVKYLELGVSEPMQISNTYMFYELGGTGILIDANPVIENKVKIVRPRDKFINCAVSGNDEFERKMKFYVCNTSAALSTLNKDHIKSGHGVLDEQFTEITVDVRGINEILSELDFCPDLVSIDIEGEDENVIRKWDFNIAKPSIFVIESMSDVTMEVMLLNGYELYAVNTGNAFFYLKH